MASAFAVSNSSGLGVGELKPQVCFSGCTQQLCSFKRTAGKEKPGHPKAVFWKLIGNVDWVTPSRFVTSGVLCKLMKLEGVGEGRGGGVESGNIYSPPPVRRAIYVSFKPWWWFHSGHLIY